MIRLLSLLNMLMGGLTCFRVGSDLVLMLRRTLLIDIGSRMSFVAEDAPVISVVYGSGVDLLLELGLVTEASSVDPSVRVILV